MATAASSSLTMELVWARDRILRRFETQCRDLDIDPRELRRRRPFASPASKQRGSPSPALLREQSPSRENRSRGAPVDPVACVPAGSTPRTRGTKPSPTAAVLEFVDECKRCGVPDGVIHDQAMLMVEAISRAMDEAAESHRLQQDVDAHKYDASLSQWMTKASAPDTSKFTTAPSTVPPDGIDHTATNLTSMLRGGPDHDREASPPPPPGSPPRRDDDHDDYAQPAVSTLAGSSTFIADAFRASRTQPHGQQSATPLERRGNSHWSPSPAPPAGPPPSSALSPGHLTPRAPGADDEPIVSPPSDAKAPHTRDAALLHDASSASGMRGAALSVVAQASPRAASQPLPVVTCDVSCQASPPAARSGKRGAAGRYGAEPHMDFSRSPSPPKKSPPRQSSTSSKSRKPTATSGDTSSCNSSTIAVRTDLLPQNHARTRRSPVRHARRGRPTVASGDQASATDPSPANPAMRVDDSTDMTEVRSRAKRNADQRTEHALCAAAARGSASAIHATKMRRVTSAASKHVERQLAARKRQEDAKEELRRRASVSGGVGVRRRLSRSASAASSARTHQTASSSQAGYESTTGTGASSISGAAIPGRVLSTAPDSSRGRVSPPRPPPTTSTLHATAPTASSGDHGDENDVSRRLEFAGPRAADTAPSSAAASGVEASRQRSSSVRSQDVDELRRQLGGRAHSVSRRSSPDRSAARLHGSSPASQSLRRKRSDSRGPSSESGADSVSPISELSTLRGSPRPSAHRLASEVRRGGGSSRAAPASASAASLVREGGGAYSPLASSSSRRGASLHSRPSAAGSVRSGPGGRLASTRDDPSDRQQDVVDHVGDIEEQDRRAYSTASLRRDGGGAFSASSASMLRPEDGATYSPSVGSARRRRQNSAPPTLSWNDLDAPADEDGGAGAGPGNFSSPTFGSLVKSVRLASTRAGPTHSNFEGHPNANDGPTDISPQSSASSAEVAPPPGTVRAGPAGRSGLGLAEGNSSRIQREDGGTFSPSWRGGSRASLSPGWQDASMRRRSTRDLSGALKPSFTNAQSDSPAPAPIATSSDHPTTEPEMEDPAPEPEPEMSFGRAASSYGVAGQRGQASQRFARGTPTKTPPPPIPLADELSPSTERAGGSASPQRRPGNAVPRMGSTLWQSQRPNPQQHIAWSPLPVVQVVTPQAQAFLQRASASMQRAANERRRAASVDNERSRSRPTLRSSPSRSPVPLVPRGAAGTTGKLLDTSAASTTTSSKGTTTASQCTEAFLRPASGVTNNAGGEVSPQSTAVTNGDGSPGQATVASTVRDINI